jgi:chitinase
MSGGVDKLSKVNWELAAPHMDFINLMTYDYYGAWSNTYGHQTGLYDTDGYATSIDGFSIDEAINYLTQQRSVPANKLAIGVASYGRAWSGITGGNQESPFNGVAQGGSPMTGIPSEGFWEAGILDYKGAEEFMMGGANGGGINGYVTQWDDAAKASYLWNPTNGNLVTLDTARSVNAKGTYVQEKGLAGLFTWEIDGDNGSILNAMHEGLGHNPL